MANECRQAAYEGSERPRALVWELGRSKMTGYSFANNQVAGLQSGWLNEFGCMRWSDRCGQVPQHQSHRVRNSVMGFLAFETTHHDWFSEILAPIYTREHADTWIIQVVAEP